MATAVAARFASSRQLHVQVVVAIVAGVALGYFTPTFAVRLQPLGDAFIQAIRMLIGPVIFCTVVHGIAGAKDLRRAGRVAIKALIYFEVMTTIALAMSLIVVNVLKPGQGMNVDPGAPVDPMVASYVAQTTSRGAVAFLMHVLPKTLVSAFADGDILQVLLVSVLFGAGLFRLGEPGRPILEMIELVSRVLFNVVAFVMRTAPLGALGAIAFTVGRYGLATLVPLGVLIVEFYLTCALFVVVVLGAAARFAGFSLWGLLRYFKEEIFIVLGTSSSETVLPRVMEKLNELGCDESVTSLVIPTGYSFNLDGTCLYLVMVTVFLAQATNVELSLGQQLAILGILLVASKGAAGVAGAAFIVLAATLGAVGSIPLSSLALVLGIHRFMGTALAITNLIGNAVATVVIAKWEGALDQLQMRARLRPVSVSRVVAN